MNKKEIQDIYALTPLQEGLLFHTLLDTESAAYFDQFIAHIDGSLDLDIFKKTWERIQANNPIFRTAFAWQTGKKPLQIVAKKAVLPIDFLDWSDRATERIDDDFMALLASDRERPFSPSKPPLMRITLVQTASESFRLVWSRHHLLLDGWSLSLILEEFVKIYAAFSANAPLPTIVRRPYREYIQWLDKQDTDAADRFWQKSLGDLEHPSRIRMGGEIRTEQAGQKFTELTGTLSRPATQALEFLARESRVSLNTVVKGAWAILLRRMSGMTDVVMGDTVSGRPESLSGVESQVGLFINTLPLRVRVPSTEKLDCWLRALQGVENELRQFEYSPLSSAQNRSGLNPSDSLFESIVVFENYPVSRVLDQGIPGLAIIATETFERTHYPITLIVAPGESLQWILITDDSIYGKEGAHSIHACLKQLFDTLPAQIQEPVGKISILPRDERSRLLRTWNNSVIRYEAETCLHQLFERRAHLTPSAIAIDDGKTRLSYAELNAQSNSLAAALIHRGIKTESRVGICMSRSERMVVAMLAVLKTGGTYVPMDPAYPADRIAYMRDDSDAELILTETRYLEPLELPDATTLCVDIFDFQRAPAYKERADIRADNLAYIIYTSGSTGLPKGTAITHRNAHALAVWAYDTFDRNDWSGVLASTSICFDLSVFEIFVTLGAGGMLVLVENALELPQHPARKNVSLINTVPSAITELLRLGGIPNSVRTINLAGEPLTAALADRLYNETSVAKVHDLYGPSEDTTYSTWIQRLPGGPATIGRPIANTRVYLLDQDIEPVPHGCIGEIFLQGHGVVRGYWQRPDLTAERFIPDPFGHNSGQRLYRTGDLARYFPDGTLEFLGRVDHQVKIRGFRIELGEIQARLERHEAIAETAVIAVEDPQQGKAIAAYFAVHNKTDAPDTADLSRYIAEALPDYMVPAFWISMEALPRTPNGKLDRKALPSYTDGQSTLSANQVAPRSDLEAQLHAIWQSVLEADAFGVTDSFFLLGGHSLMATRILSRIRKTISQDVPLRLVFESHTIEAQARALEDFLQPEPGAEIGDDTIPSVDGSVEQQLSHAQERIWFFQQFDPGNPAYNIPIAIQLKGAIKADLIEEAFAILAERHSALRTQFRSVNGRPTQRVAPSAKVPWSTEGLHTDDFAERRERIALIGAAEATQVFDLDSGGPLIRVRLVFEAEDQATLFITLHHIIADGWSLGVLLDDLAGALFGLISHTHPELPAIPVQYPDYAVWQRARLKSELAAKQADFWKQTLQSVQPLELPLDYTRPAELSFRGASITRTLDSGLSSDLSELGHQAHIPLFAILLSGLQVLLSRFSGQTDFAIGTAVSGRTHHDIEQTVGVFVNTLAYPCRFSQGSTLDEVISATTRFSNDALAHQDLPFEQLIELLDLERDLGRAPIFQVLYVHQNTPLQQAKIPGLGFKPLVQESQTSKFELTVSSEQTEHGLRLSFEYNTALFRRETIQRWIDSFEVLLHAFVKQRGLKVAQAPIMPRGERDLLLKFANVGTPLTHAEPRLCHVAIAQQCRLTPDALATSFSDGSAAWTYAELDERAEAIAHDLAHQGCGPGSIVGYMLPPGPEALAAILGILKSGAAYLPIDPNYPEERIRYMIEDSGAAAVIGLGHDLAIDFRSSDRELGFDDPIYLIYTSGSTGKPKGALVHHGGPKNLALWYQREVKITHDSRFLIISSLSFDLTQKNLLTPLMSGASVYFLKSEAFDPWQILDAIEIRGITHINCAPSALYPIVELAAKSEFSALKSLRYVVLGGETIAVDRLSAWMRHPAINVRVLNSYGPTETSDVCSADWVLPDDTETHIGTPLPGSTVYVIDDQGQLTPTGCEGEIAIGGVGVGHGYWNRPELTADRFLPDPYTGGERRLYRTGDLGKVLPSGKISFVGRKDFQVKIRGLRVELGEIEHAVRNQPGVRSCAVIVKDAPHNPRLVAFYESETDDVQIDLNALGLPEYMIPGQMVWIEAMPHTPSGKTDYKTLGTFQLSPQKQVEETEALESAEEKALGAIWCKILNLPSIGRNDDFFRIGGDSILSIQVIANAREVGYALTPRDLFRHPTLSALAKVSQHLKQTADHQETLTGSCPLGPIQRWFFDQNFPHAEHWNQSMLLASDYPLNADHLAAALLKLIEHHDALRLVFGDQAHFAKPSDLEDRLLIVRPMSAFSEEVCKKLQGDLTLETGPLFRAALFQDNEGQSARLLLIAHHLVVDGVSWQIILEDLATLYAAQDSSEAVALPTKSINLRDWIDQLHAYSQTEAHRAAQVYWASQPLNQIQALPRDLPQGSNLAADSRYVSTHLSNRETQALLDHSEHIQTLLLTALARTLKPWTQKQANWVQVEGHGRILPGSQVNNSRTVGWFTALYPVCLDTGFSADIAAQIKKIGQRLESIPNGGIDAGILNYISGEASIPQPEIAFNFLGQVDRNTSNNLLGLRPAKEPSGSHYHPSNPRPYLLEINGSIREGELELIWSYSAGVHHPNTIDALAQQFASELLTVTQIDTQQGSSAVSATKIKSKDMKKLISKFKSST